MVVGLLFGSRGIAVVWCFWLEQRRHGFFRVEAADAKARALKGQQVDSRGNVRHIPQKFKAI